MSLEPSLSVNNVVTAKLKYVEEKGNVQGPKNVVRAEVLLVSKLLETIFTVRYLLVEVFQI